jgi:hypothetical protein
MQHADYFKFKKNFTPQLWAFLEISHCTEAFIRNSTNPLIGGALAVNPDLVINQLETAFSFAAVKNTEMWLSLNKEWKVLEQTTLLVFSPKKKAKDTMHAKMVGLIVSLVLFVMSIIGVNTATDQYINLACTVVAFTCMCSLFALLLSGPYPKEEVKEHTLFTSKTKHSWIKL